MKPRFAAEYWAELFRPGSYENLVQIVSFLCGASAYDSSEADYGLGVRPFLLVESLQWFATSVRSGSIAYFESTPIDRQTLMAGALSAHAPSGFAAHYEAGMIASKDGSSLSLVDAWVDVNDGINNEWLWALATELQPKILAVIS